VRAVKSRKIAAIVHLGFASLRGSAQKSDEEAGMSLDRRTFAVACGAALALPGAGWAQTAGDMSIGDAGASVHLVEYASMTCPHCAEFHHTNWTALKTRYVDTGRVRLTMREMVTPPAPVSLGMFQVARCGGAAAPEYFRRVGILFARQNAIVATGSMAGVRDALIAIGAEWGLSQAQIMAALTDQSGVTRIEASIQEAMARGVQQTPSFYINNAAVTDNAFLTPAGMTRILDAALG